VGAQSYGSRQGGTARLPKGFLPFGVFYFIFSNFSQGGALPKYRPVDNAKNSLRNKNIL
jgi:hypothetical protein